MRRSRHEPAPTTGLLEINEHDARGYMEPLSRLFFLPTSRLILFDKRHPQGSRDRLTDVSGEPRDWKAEDKPLIRLLSEMKSRGIGSPAFYKNGPAAPKHLMRWS